MVPLFFVSVRLRCALYESVRARVAYGIQMSSGRIATNGIDLAAEPAGLKTGTMTRIFGSMNTPADAEVRQAASPNTTQRVISGSVKSTGTSLPKTNI